MNTSIAKPSLILPEPESSASPQRHAPTALSPRTLRSGEVAASWLVPGDVFRGATVERVEIATDTVRAILPGGGAVDLQPNEIVRIGS